MPGKALSLSSLIALSLVGTASAGEDTLSANALLPGCRVMITDMDDHLSGPAPSYGEPTAMKQGVCMGVITGLNFEARLSKSVFKKAFFCIPDSVTFGQQIQVVVAFIDNHPQDMHERFDWLAIKALADAWPCKD